MIVRSRGEDSNNLTPTMRRLLQELFDDLKTLESRIGLRDGRRGRCGRKNSRVFWLWKVVI
jgi:hypothetical protein